MKKLYLFLIVLFLLNSVFALSTTLTANPASLNLNAGDTSQITVSYTIDNTNGFAGASGVAISGSPKLLTYSGGSLSYGVNMSASGTFTASVNIPSNSSTDDVTNTITIDNAVLSIPIHITQLTPPSSIILFPTSKIVNIQQGLEKSISIQIIVPSNYPRTINIQSVNANPETDLVSFLDLDLGILNPGQSLTIPLKVNAKSAQLGTYNSQINILATDSLGQITLPSVNLQIIVSVGTSPATNSTFATRPICSLSAIEMSLNSSVTFSCTNVIDNIDISPQYNEFIEGIRADFISNIYTYTFKPTKIGSTKFISVFTYKGSPVFNPFSQEIRVTTSGNQAVLGTNLKIEWYQNSIKKQVNQIGVGMTNLVILDDKTDSTINSYAILLNGLPVNNTINFEGDKTYNLRVSSPGFVDLVISNLTVNKNQLSFSIDPEKDIYEGGDLINVNCSASDCSILLDNVVVANPFYIYSGEHIIKVAKEGYVSFEKNFTVIEPISLTACTPMQQDWKYGSKVICDINKNATITVINPKGEVAVSTTGSRFEFKIDSIGIWIINGNDKKITEKNIEQSNWFGWMTWTNIKSHWIISLIVVVVLLVIVFIVIKKIKRGSGDKTPPYEFKI